MKRGVRINNNVLLFVFTIVYIIIPDYFYVNLGVGNMKFQLIWPCICLIVFFYLYRKNITISDEQGKSFAKIWVLWIATRCLIGLLHGDAVDALTLIIRFGVVLIIFMNLVNTKKRFLKIIDVIIYTGAIVALLGLVEEVTGYNFFGTLNTVDIELNYNVLRYGLLRIISFTSHAITYGVFCMFILGLIFYRVSNCEDRTKKNVFRAIYVLVFANLICTVSRSSIIFCVLSQILLLWCCGYTKMIKLMIKIVLTVIAVCIIGSLLSDTIASIVSSVVYTVLALFDESYAEMLSSAYQGDNAGGIGNRFELYEWVWDTVKNDCLIGKGAASEFSYKFVNSAGYERIKESIEVQYLSTLYHYGILGLLPELALYIELLKMSFFSKIKKNTWESKLNFSSMFGCILIAYLLCMFAVAQSTEQGLFFVMIGLLATYLRHNRFEEN